MPEPTAKPGPGPGRPHDMNIVLPDAPAAGSPSAPGPGHLLPTGTRMGEFELLGLIGEGSFGIVYLARDHSLGRQVAIKEYMPASLAARTPSMTVALRSQRHADTFEAGLRSFINEARLLAQFDHPSLIKVYRFWEAGGTAYMAMPYYIGRTLQTVLGDMTGPPTEAWLRTLLAPILEAIEVMHTADTCHRDIAPDNILILDNGRPVVLDLGAARHVIGDMTQALTVILKPGYAPIEQYGEMPGIKQGPWTDVYAIGAVLYHAITGQTPPQSVTRVLTDKYEPITTRAAGHYSPAFLAAIDQCLAVMPQHRPQSTAELRALLAATEPPPTTTWASAPTPTPSTPPEPAALMRETRVILPMSPAPVPPLPPPLVSPLMPPAAPSPPLARWLARPEVPWIMLAAVLLAGAAGYTAYQSRAVSDGSRQASAPVDLPVPPPVSPAPAQPEATQPTPAPATASAAQGGVYTPEPKSPERVEIVDLLREAVEADLGRPIKFSVRRLNVTDTHAFASVRPRRPDGQAVHVSTPCEIDGTHLVVEALLKKVDGRWRFDLPASGRFPLCSHDTTDWEAQIQQRHLPPQLLQ